MTAVALFGGTTEGRELSVRLGERGVAVEVFVATDYGRDLMEPAENLTVTAGRLNRDEMTALFRRQRFDAVVDATHPYAVEVTANLEHACRETGLRYLRLTRRETGHRDCLTVDSVAAAAQVLDSLPGNVLLTVGSKELAAFVGVHDYRQRLFARVLPDPDVVAGCARLGFRGRNLICMQGPFSHEMNTATMDMYHIGALVTKDTGKEGGLPEKLSAARQLGAKVVLVRRPNQEEGHSADSIVELLAPGGGPGEKTAPLTARFPLFVSLGGRPALVVGGGKVAARRVKALLSFGAEVTVVSPVLTPELSAMGGSFHWHRSCYSGLDRSYTLAVAATGDRTVNRQVGADCNRRGIPVSVADSGEESTFWFPAIIRGRGLVGGLVSTDGDHRRVKQSARKIRALLEENT